MFSENKKYEIYYITELNQFVICQVEDDSYFFPMRVNGKVLFKDLETLYAEFNSTDPDNAWTEYNSVYGGFNRRLHHYISSYERFLELSAEHLI